MRSYPIRSHSSVLIVKFKFPVQLNSIETECSDDVIKRQILYRLRQWIMDQLLRAYDSSRGDFPGLGAHFVTHSCKPDSQLKLIWIRTDQPQH